MEEANRSNSAAASPPGQWDLVKQIAGEALEQPRGSRVAYAQARCGGDEGLWAQVASLLEASDFDTQLLGEGGIPGSLLDEAMHSPAAATGSQIGRYTLGAMLGSGGMGTVFEAMDPMLSRPVAIKLLNLGVASTRARRRFEAEARALARLEHPGIARVFEAGVHAAAGQAVSVPYFAMEFVPAARTLDAWVRTEHPTLRRHLMVLAQVCDAVHHGHQKGVLHRDLKPSNILVTPSGEPKIIDFGVAKLVGDSEEAATRTGGDVAGTPAYMPPEAFERGLGELDIRADVYALGIVMYESLSGVHPRGSAGLTPHQAGLLACSQSPVALSSHRRECRGEVETIVHTAMDADLSQRYQSVAELAADIRRVLNSQPILAKPASLWRQCVLFARRRRALTAAAGIAVAAVALGFAGLEVGLSKARESEQRARAEAERSRQTSRFVMQMLQSARPFREAKFAEPLTAAPEWSMQGEAWPSAASPGRAPTVGDLIMVAMDRLEGAFPGDAALQADMAATLAQTAASLSDARLQTLQRQSALLLERAYGPDDRRSLVARHLLHSTMVLDGSPAPLEEMKSDLSLMRRLHAADRELLHRAARLYLQVMGQNNRLEEAMRLVEEIRQEMAQGGDASERDDAALLSLDTAILYAKTTTPAQAASAIESVGALLDRARAIDVTPGRLTLMVLFHKQEYQRAADDLKGAIETLEEGTELSTRFYGGMDKSSYEWWGTLYFVSIQARDFVTAEHAARQQLTGAQAMLGPHSLYTTKAYGRLARALLSQGTKLAEAERAARQAVDGAPDLLERGDGWAIFHEALWACAIRQQGDWERSLKVLRDRMTVETSAGRPNAVEWAEVVRWAELAQGEMDRAIAQDRWAERAAEIESCIRQSESFAAKLEPGWPSAQLAVDARARFAAESAKRGR
jgi:serine/threonine protein kinase/tetratricopeptide (TPR) repeat protein